jgi:hypothetical protein
MRSLMLSLLVLLTLGFSQGVIAQIGPVEPAPTVESLGVADWIAQEEVDQLWSYYKYKSNAVRKDAQMALNAAHGNFRDPQVMEAWTKVAALDESVHGTISKLILKGYWLKSEGRNKDFDGAVWLALQHIFDQALVDLTLAQIKPLIAKGIMSGESYALMYDRNELSHGRPQVYGSQFQCKDGRAVVQDLLDPGQVDDRRKQAGMVMNFADYRSLMENQCAA